MGKVTRRAAAQGPRYAALSFSLRPSGGSLSHCPLPLQRPQEAGRCGRHDSQAVTSTAPQSPGQHGAAPPPPTATREPPALRPRRARSAALRCAAWAGQRSRAQRAGRRTCAASEMSRMTMSELAMTSNTSPRVPSASVNPTARASSHDGESGRRPMATCGERGEGATSRLGEAGRRSAGLQSVCSRGCCGAVWGGQAWPPARKAARSGAACRERSAAAPCRALAAACRGP